MSFVMPVLNEFDYVRRAIESVLAQRYPAATELVIVLGPSSDGTDEIVLECAAIDPRIRVVPIERANIAAALNRGTSECRHPVIARVDAHVELPEDYAERSVRALVTHHAGNVGGIMVAVGRTPFQRAAAEAYNSRWGLGGGAYHLLDTPAGEGESTYLGVMWADVIAGIGGFDESLERGEDWEFNYRLRQAGHRVWIEPSIQVRYFPRATAVGLAQQFWATGACRAELVRRLRTANSPRYFAPPVLVAAAGAAVFLNVVRLLGLRRRAVRFAARATATVPLAHVAVIAGVAARQSEHRADAARVAAALTVMHYAWGAGFLAGILPGERRLADRSRVRRAAVGAPNTDTDVDVPAG